jgi:hypothetical protein
MACSPLSCIPDSRTPCFPLLSASQMHHHADGDAAHPRAMQGSHYQHAVRSKSRPLSPFPHPPIPHPLSQTFFGRRVLCRGEQEQEHHGRQGRRRQLQQFPLSEPLPWIYATAPHSPTSTTYPPLPLTSPSISPCLPLIICSSTHSAAPCLRLPPS